MRNKLYFVSMNGRMAYTIMCVEAFLKARYPEKDWTFISEMMWKATLTNWSDWTEEYSAVIPDVLLQYDEYDSETGELIYSKRQIFTLESQRDLKMIHQMKSIICLTSHMKWQWFMRTRL